MLPVLYLPPGINPKTASRPAQRSLAEAAGVPGRTVEKWETGQLPSMLVLRPLARVLGVGLDELIPEESGPKELVKKSLAPAAKRRRPAAPVW